MNELEFPPLYPSTLHRTDSTPLWYLDLKDWIGLASARLERPSGRRYQRLLTALRRAREQGSVRVVLSNPLFREISQIEAPRQRKDLADVIDELTDFEYLAGQVEVAELEIEASLDATFVRTEQPLGHMSLVGTNLLYSFGMKGGLNIFDGDGTDITREWREQHPHELTKLERTAERMLLAGPSDADVEAMRAEGYRPEKAQQTIRDNLEFDKDLAQHKLDDHWRHGRLRDVILARHLFYELNEMLYRQMRDRGRQLQDLGQTLDERRAFVLRMPSQRVVVELRTSYHRDASHQWTTNDLHDIAAMSLALPYCDVALADAATRNHALRTGLDRLLEVALPRTPDEAAELIPA
jgi:hypothetical protein